MKANGVILFDPFPATGHVNACITLAKFLSSHGFHIWFSGIPDFKNKIRDEGFEYYVISPFLFTPSGIEIEEMGALKFMMENIGNSRLKKLQQEFRKTASEYDRLIELIKPDLILFDDHYAQKAIYYDKYKIPIITVQTMLPPLKSQGAPPFQSNYIPTSTTLSKKFTEFLWKKTKFTQSVKNLKEYILTFGQTNHQVFRALCPESKLTLEKERCFGVGIRELPMISTSPKAFDFPKNAQASDLLYFGKQEYSSLKKIEDPRLHGLLKKVQEKKKQNPRQALIYCSLGTLTQIREKVAQNFFSTIILTAKKNPGIEFILSTGKHFNISELSDTPGNLSAYPSVPQKQLLRHVDIMITHGGLNSIRECIDEGIPMIVYPLNKKVDQPGNAARIAFHNLGKTGDVRTATSRSVAKKISSILKEKSQFKTSLQNMKQEIRESNRSEEKKILELIFQLTGKKTDNLKTHYEIH